MAELREDGRGKGGRVGLREGIKEKGSSRDARPRTDSCMHAFTRTYVHTATLLGGSV